MEVIARSLLAVGVNYGVHFMSARFYDAFCVPHTLQEIAQTLVTTASPICATAINVVHMTQSNYASVITITLAGGIVNLLKA
jgi:predicted RND superfamily exporter protein